MQTATTPTKAQSKAKAKRAEDFISFKTGAARLTGITGEQRETWAAAYPLVNIRAELTRAECFLMSNPPQPASSRQAGHLDLVQFLTGRMAQAQVRAATDRQRAGLRAARLTRAAQGVGAAHPWFGRMSAGQQAAKVGEWVDAAMKAAADRQEDRDMQGAD